MNTLVVPLENNKCFVVDPSACSVAGDETIILDYLQKNNLQCTGILLTHTHFDHIMGISVLKQAFPSVIIAAHKEEASELSGQGVIGPMNNSLLSFFGATQLKQEVASQPAVNRLLKEGDNWFGWKVMHTPGHSPGSICLYKDDCLICGDTMFAYGGYGRTDMYGGDETLIQKSLKRIRNEIPKGTHFYPGHDSCGVL